MSWPIFALVFILLSSLIGSYLFYKAWKNRKDISSTLIKTTVFAKRYIRRRKYIEKLEQKQEQLQVATISVDELESKRKEQRRKRGFILKEILETERRYVTDLQVLQDYYMEPMKKIAFSNTSNSQIFKKETYELMFQNLETIIGVNKVFLKELESIEETGIAPMVSSPVKARSNTVTGATNTIDTVTHSKRPKRNSLLALKDLLNISKKNKPKSSPPPPVPKKPSEFSTNIKSELQAEAASSKEEELAKLLAYFSHSFKLYTDYISNFKNTTMIMEQEKKNPEFEKLIKDMRNKIPYTPKPTLDSLLITPIQRLCRYRLLLEELVKNCAYEEQLHKKVLKAVEAMKTVASYVNEKERENENIFKMVSLQNRLGNNYTILTPSSKLVKDLEFFLDEEEDALNKPVACLCSFENPETEVPVDTLFIFTDSIVIELAQLDSSELVQEEIAYVIPYNILVSIKKAKKDTIEISYKRNNTIHQISLHFQLSNNASNSVNALYEVMGKILNLVTQYKELAID